MIADQVKRFLENWPVGSLIKATDMSEKLEAELVRQGYLRKIASSGYGYGLVAYERVQPNGQTDQ